MGERLFLRLEGDALHGPESSAPAGTLKAFDVPPALRDSVSQVMLYRETIPRGVEIHERVLPDGMVRVVIELGDAPCAGGGANDERLSVVGSSTAPAMVRMRGHVEGLSIALRPGATAALLGVPAGELAEAVVPLDALGGPWREDARELRDRLSEAADDEERVAAVQSMLLRRLRGASPARSRAAARAARMFAASGGRRTVREVAVEVGVGERRLQQLFHEHVGLSPRAWSRLARLHACLRSLRHERAPAWAELAVDHGFYDQSHLVNEFRALCGMTPAEFFRRVTSHSSKTAG